MNWKSEYLYLLNEIQELKRRTKTLEGAPLYRHTINATYSTLMSVYFDIFTDSDAPLTDTEIIDYLYNGGYIPCSGIYTFTTVGGSSYGTCAISVYENNEVLYISVLGYKTPSDTNVLQPSGTNVTNVTFTEVNSIEDSNRMLRSLRELNRELEK